MKQFFFIALLLLPQYFFAQTPEKAGLKQYLIPDAGDTIHFYIYQPDSSAKTKVFLYLQGTGTYPMINADDSGQCCYNNYPKPLMKGFPKEYAFVYINKVGLPYYAKSRQLKVTQRFTERNNVADRAEVANKVLNYVVEKIYPKATVIAVLGHSEGTHVLARLASLNYRITHVCFASGSGHSHLYDEVQLIRSSVDKGERTPIEAEARLKKLYMGIDSVLQSPMATDKFFWGDTYKWWYEEISRPPIDDLLRLSIPVLLTAGSRDDKVPVEGSDYINTEFVRRRKNNLTYKVYLNCDHSYVETLPTGEKKDRWNELFTDFLQFIATH